MRVKFFPDLEPTGDPYTNYVDRMFFFPRDQPYVPFSVTWEGTFTGVTAGEYRFYFRATDTAQLLVDGNVLASYTYDPNEFNNHRESETPITLDVGPHVVEVIYEFTRGDRDVNIQWQTPDDHSWQPLPFADMAPAPP